MTEQNPDGQLDADLDPLTASALGMDWQDERRQEQQLREDDDLRAVMGTPAGRRFIWRQLQSAGLWRSSFTGERQGTDFREGMRNTALMLWAELQRACPDLTLRMQQETRDV